jgi:hypothetical protein
MPGESKKGKTGEARNAVSTAQMQARKIAADLVAQRQPPTKPSSPDLMAAAVTKEILLRLPSSVSIEPRSLLKQAKEYQNEHRPTSMSQEPPQRSCCSWLRNLLTSRRSRRVAPIEIY